MQGRGGSLPFARTLSVRRTACAGLAGLVLLLVLPRTLCAEGDTHYQDTLIGERAAGMGGAFTALGNEATGSFYNPAGIVVDQAALIQVSMSAWRWRRKETTVGDICGTQIKEDEGGFYGFPASFGVVKLFGTKVRQALGLSLIVPFYSKASQSGVIRDANCEPLSMDFGIGAISVDRVFLIASTYAIRPWHWLQLGLSLGFAARDASYAQLTSVVARVNGQALPFPTVTFFDADVTIWNAYLQLGAIVEPLAGLRVGVSFTTPYLRLAGKGRLDQVEVAENDANTAGTLNALVADNAEFYWKVPYRLALGIAYQHHERFTLAADLSLNGAVGSYAVYTHPQLGAADGSHNQRELVLNVNVGAELQLRKKLALRAGFFTNFSSVPRLSAAAMAEAEVDRTNLFGLSIGASYRGSSASVLSLALQGQLGSGQGGSYRVYQSGDAAEPVRSEIVASEIRDYSLIVMIGGSVDLR